MIINPYRFGQPLLLDTYSGAAVAYSVRKLRTAFSGAALRVRRSSDNAETDIGFVSNQLDTVSLLSFVGAGNGFVTRWYDQSGNGQNLTQTTAANQPRIINSGVLITQGIRPSLLTDNNDNFNLNFLPVYSRIDQYYVVKPNVNTYIYPFGNNGTGQVGYVAQSGSTSTFIEGYSTISNLYANNVIFTGINRNDVFTFLNKYAIVLHENSTNNGWGGQFNLFYYSGFEYVGNVQEIIYYPFDQSANRTAINTNINSYFNIYP